MQVAELAHRVDPRLVQKMHELVSEGVRNPKEMKRHLKSHVKKEIFNGEAVPSTENRRFFPRMKDIRNHIYTATVKLRYSKIDQVSVEEKINEWQKENELQTFFFRKYAVVKAEEETLHKTEDVDGAEGTTEDVKINDKEIPGDSLLLVHQTEWQKRLLSRYGNGMCLLDATYKTTRYSLAVVLFSCKNQRRLPSSGFICGPK